MTLDFFWGGGGRSSLRNFTLYVTDLYIFFSILYLYIFILSANFQVNKLVELYKESSEEWSRKAGELEGVIKALEVSFISLVLFNE